MLGTIFGARKARLDRDRDQHHLASMLISIAAGRDEVSRADLDAFVAAKGWSGADWSVRRSHAAKLAGTAVSGELYDKVIQLARDIG
ncbi:hypothetical protein P1X14_13115 [Sphingomonas sp. AOB5]|uniref:hypothetical protein n=1 Tax=Sphingomonas sp. AOB5 TaxID=3034017 RepID=UPI0023F62152|nr:hypothetical protein [Sphingomonas sp. AOB5]MDF7776192.1 hypothetical protein [Sphingomonas sp. AOB5]